MPSESWSTNPTPSPKSLESVKETFKQRLDVILYKQLTVENIETFADKALSETVKLTEDVLKEYKSNPNIYPNQIPLDKQVQENEAFAILGLPNISEILQSIIDVKSKIDALGKYISENNIITEKVMIPPQHDSLTEIKGNSGTGVEEKKLIPRLITLLYILETDFGIEKEQIKITEGKVTSEMVRKTPYVRMEVSDIERIIYICDEEGNASYVFNTDKLEEAGILTENLDVSDKGKINDLIAKHPGIGVRIVQTKHWRTNMAELLGNPIPEKVPVEKSTQPISEFVKREKKEFLSFGDFKIEVIALYSGESNLYNWYKNERKKHSNWPALPNVTYKESWPGFPELLGKENKFKKEYPPFDDFQAEVLNLYPGEGDVETWYRNEKIKHPKWPSKPNRIYKHLGFIGWPELIGKESRYRKEFLAFDDFHIEVQSLYLGEDNIQKWYHSKKLDHSNWPSNPSIFYKDNWKSWPELVGKKEQ